MSRKLEELELDILKILAKQCQENINRLIDLKRKIQFQIAKKRKENKL